MEERNIIYSGITQAASDFDCKDGELSLSHNIISRDGSMRPIVLPDTLFTLEEGETLLFVHSVASRKNYIFLKGGKVGAFRLDGSTRHDYTLSHTVEGSVRSVQAVGNTLVLVTDRGMSYVLWKEDIEEYLSLGEKIPDVDISFGLVGRSRLYSVSDESKSTFSITFDGIAEDKLYETFSEDNQRKITDQVMAKVNRFVREQGSEKGRFVFPFFVRYALRLFDGSLVNHSAPVLMVPSSSGSPVVIWKHIRGKENYTDAELDIFMVPSSIDYQVLVGGAPEIKNNWSDIVKSIDIFVSSSIYTYDQNGLCKSFSDTNNFNSVFIGRLYSEYYASNQRFSPNGTVREDVLMGPYKADSEGEYPFLDMYLEYRYRDIYSMCFSADRSYPLYALNLPEVDFNAKREAVLNNSLFYYLASIKTEEIEWNTGRKEISVAEGYLENLETREVMTDDYQSHDRKLPSYGYVYNQRLNIANIKRELFEGFSAASMFCYKQYQHGMAADKDTHEIEFTYSWGDTDIAIYTYINEGGKDIVISSRYGQGLYQLGLSEFISGELQVTRYDKDGNPQTSLEKIRTSWGAFLFYPNPNAYKMVVTDRLGKYEVPLTEHRNLNGAYAFVGFDVVRNSNLAGSVTVSYDRTVENPNKLYTSEVGNPFHFPLGGINTVGVGRIVGISSTTRALSQGQFGQFPLLVFATDGIWAMEVSQEGLYSVRQPVSRDVCSNPESITQTDGMVVFVSEKGLMAIDGSNVDVVSAELDGTSFDISSVGRLDEILRKEGLDGRLGGMVPVREFLSSCRIAYDYPNARLFLFDPERKYAYVYSLYSRTWATADSDMLCAVTDYPGCLVQMSDGGVVDISDKTDFDSDKTVRTFMLSRPLKLGDDAFKTVNAVMNRGIMRRGNGAVILFASYDGLQYVPIGSAAGDRITRMQGTPYRYFRIGTVKDMTIREAVSMTSVYITPKWRNRPR